MVDRIPVCFAEYGPIKALALIGVAVIFFLYWDEFKQKRIRNRERREMEERQRKREERIKSDAGL